MRIELPGIALAAQFRIADAVRSYKGVLFRIVDVVGARGVALFRIADAVRSCN